MARWREGIYGVVEATRTVTYRIFIAPSCLRDCPTGRTIAPWPSRTSSSRPCGPAPWSSPWMNGASGASRAVMPVPCPMAPRVSARSASTAAGRSTSRGGTSAACSVTRSRRSHSSTYCPAAWRYSFGMLGCDLHCGYCQNWVTSQALRDPSAVVPPRYTDPETLVREAVRAGARLLVSTYNEPLITAEWAVEIFTHARRAGLLTAFVSNGNATPQVLDYLQPHIDCYKVDLKSFDDKHYRQLGGRLAPILETIASLHARGIWVEVVTLLVPGFNDSPAEIAALTQFLAGVSPDIPWHVTAFHADYRMTETRRHDGPSVDRRRRHRHAERPALRLCGQSSRPRGGPRGHEVRWVRSDARRAARICGRRESRDVGRGLSDLQREDARNLVFSPSRLRAFVMVSCYPPLVCISRCGSRLNDVIGTNACRSVTRKRSSAPWSVRAIHVSTISCRS